MVKYDYLTGSADYPMSVSAFISQEALSSVLTLGKSAMSILTAPRNLLIDKL